MTSILRTHTDTSPEVSPITDKISGDFHNCEVFVLPESRSHHGWKTVNRGRRSIRLSFIAADLRGHGVRDYVRFGNTEKRTVAV
jgi:hypothetical protein